MSTIKFEHDINNETSDLLKRLFKRQLIDMDRRLVLINQFTHNPGTIDLLTALAGETPEINGSKPGDARVMDDGTTYVYTKTAGWVLPK